MKRPERLRLFGRHWTVHRVQAEDYGYCDYDRQRIEIAEGATLEVDQDTLLHEIFHAVDNYMGTGLTEEQVRGMATGVLAVLKDNPSLVRYLMRKVKESPSGDPAIDSNVLTGK